MDDVLRIDDHGRVRLLTLDRPAALNSFNDALYDSVAHALGEAAQASGVACVVLTGSGKAFTAGQDLDELLDPPGHADGGAHGFLPFIDALASFPKPLVAAVNGLAVGVGCTLLPHCDIVLVSESARIRAPFTSLGVVPEAASTRMLPAVMGPQAAAELLFTSDWLDAGQAVQDGLARRAVPPEDLLEEALALAQRIAAMPIRSLVETKRLLLEARGDTADLIRREFELFLSMVGGPANTEAIAAFRGKRPADFSQL